MGKGGENVQIPHKGRKISLEELSEVRDQPGTKYSTRYQRKREKNGTN
jgi:hypothetical protein